ncbi:hypothetical protein NIES37_22180 [Tolypothrix tenuis PCC 7101]|uniref:Uncharacterized protein n=1 Tax=Tolypothrix tenuis PCC 7101 TaxID=231146 RepID=A0A1Z4MXW8_9CYAN|nr:hypothetical protein NIES37_22180 [Tolypothrix tenuis PCC 7101]BAZ77811.1 hypothetical protein NIES50_64440 [Aulosira laxa NIES-50]
MAKLVQIIYTSQFKPPVSESNSLIVASPDPSGIVYIDHLQSLFIADGEVDEMKTRFVSKNLFETTLTGSYVDNNLNAINFTQEATGITYNPQNRFLYISDDDRSRIYQVNPGADGKYSTSDDVVTYFSTKIDGVLKSDSEDVAYSTRTGNLWVVDGLNAQVYQYTTSGQLVSQFGAALADPEGIVEDPLTGNLFLVGRPLIEAGIPVYYVFEVTNTGQVVSKIDISAANPNKPAGITIAPNSQDPSKRSLYIVDRGLDNDDHPDENDGRIYEFLLDGNGSTNPTPDTTSGGTTSGGTTSGGTTSGGTTSGGTTSGGTTSGGTTSGDTTTSGGTTSGSSTSLDSKFTTVFVANSASTNTTNTLGAVSFDKQDILAYNQNTKIWSMYFDGSDVFKNGSSNLKDVRLRDFHINSDGSILFAINQSVTLPGAITADEYDVIKFTPTSTGENTSGTFQIYLDGSKVGLDPGVKSEVIDGIAIDSDGALVISTRNGFKVPGASGTELSGSGEDLIKFNGTTGENTVGTWTMLFDGSDVGLKDNNIDSFWLDYDSNKNIKYIYLSTEKAFSITNNSKTITGSDSDILRFTPTSLGNDTKGSFELITRLDGLGASTIEGLAVSPNFSGF